MTYRAAAATHPPPERRTAAPSASAAAAFSKHHQQAGAYPRRPRQASDPSPHEDVATVLKAALVLHPDAEGWVAFSAIAGANLSRFERAALAWAALFAAEDEDLDIILDGALGPEEPQVPPLFTEREEAALFGRRVAA